MPEKTTTSQVEIVKLASKVSPPAYIIHNNSRFLFTVLIDSGSAVNLINSSLAVFESYCHK